MPATLELPREASDEASHGLGLPGKGQARGLHRPRIRVGVVNNMPDSALAATERQFAELLDECSPDFDVRLRFYALDSIVRSTESRRAMQAKYHPVQSLHAMWHDALIVTGAEPSARSLPQETFWRELVGVFDFARTRTRSTVFSCLAAHAAVLHLDGVERIALRAKASGVFRSRVVKPHPLLEGFPTTFWTPHSRFNGVDETVLADKGYTILARSDAGVDLFIKHEASLLVFLQGHPEYLRDSLLREFRRDLSRYLAGARATAPEPPTNCLSPDVAAEISALLNEAKRDRRLELADRFPRAALDTASDSAWRGHSRLFYRNWLAILAHGQMHDRSRAAPDRRAAARRVGGRPHLQDAGV